MATNPTPTACLKCNTPLIPGAGFCGTCGTPAGQAGTPPLPPPMPPRPMAHGARQVSLPMDQANALHTASGVIASQKGEITNHSMSQIAFRIGSYLSGRWTGTIDSHQDRPGNTNLNVMMKADYASLLPAAGVFLVVSVISTILLVKSATDAQFAPIDFNNPVYTPRSPGIGAYLQWWMIWLFDAVVLGLCAFLLGGPLLESRRNKLLGALQYAGGGAAPGMPLPGMPAPGMTPPPHMGGQPAPFAPPPGVPGAPGGFPPPQQQAAPPSGIPAQGLPAPATPFDQLRKLAELRDAGSLSQDQYDEAKAAILAKVS